MQSMTYMPYAKGLFKLGLGASVAGGTVLKADVYTFTGDINSGWRVNGNWDEPDWPEDGDTAIIPANKTVCVGCDDSQFDSACTDIQVASTAVVEIEGVDDDFSLTLKANSTIDGQIIFTGSGMAAPKLSIAGNLTISSSGDGAARIRGGIEHDGLSFGMITSVGDSVLTIASGFTIQGAVSVDAKAVNQGLFLVNHASDTMSLDGGNEKSGTSTGKWKVTAGELHVRPDVTVAGGAKWVLKVDPETSAIVIHCDVTINDLTGDVDQTGGTFRFQSDFCTTGDVTLKSVAASEDPHVSVEFGKTATFNAASCP